VYGNNNLLFYIILYKYHIMHSIAYNYIDYFSNKPEENFFSKKKLLNWCMINSNTALSVIV